MRLPPLRPSPDDCDVVLNDGTPGLNDGRGGHRRLTRLSDGLIVRFCSLTDYGPATLTIYSVMEWAIDPPMPPEAKRVSVTDRQQSYSPLRSVNQCVQFIMNDQGGDPGEYSIHYYTWEHGIPFMFDAFTRTFNQRHVITRAANEAAA